MVSAQLGENLSGHEVAQLGTRYRAMFPDANTRGVNLSASRSDKASASAGLLAVTFLPSDATRVLHLCSPVSAC